MGVNIKKPKVLLIMQRRRQGCWRL